MRARVKPFDDRVEILVAEDSPTQAEALRYALEQKGYRVTLARDGKQALDCLNGAKPALIISDIIMPEMNGTNSANASNRMRTLISYSGAPADFPVLYRGCAGGPDLWSG
jgi:PleD family two-component response regulator